IFAADSWPMVVRVACILASPRGQRTASCVVVHYDPELRLLGADHRVYLLRREPVALLQSIEIGLYDADDGERCAADAAGKADLVDPAHLEMVAEHEGKAPAAV